MDLQFSQDSLEEACESLELTDLHRASHISNELLLGDKRERGFEEREDALVNAAKYTEHLQRSYEDKIAALSVKLKIVQEENAHIVRVVQQYESRLSDRTEGKSALDAYLTEIESLKISNSEMNERNRELSEQFCEVVEQNKKLQSQIAALEQEVKQTTESTSIAHKIEQSTHQYYESLLQAAEGRERALQVNTADLHDEISKLKTVEEQNYKLNTERLQNLRSMVTVLEKVELFFEVLQRDETVANCCERAEKLGILFSRLESRVLTLERIINDQRSAKADKLSKATERVVEQEQLAEIQKQQLEHFNALLASQQKALQELEVENQSLERQVQQWEANYGSLVAENDLVKREAENAEDRAGDLHGQIQCLTEQNEQLKAELRRRIA